MMITRRFFCGCFATAAVSTLAAANTSMAAPLSVPKINECEPFTADLQAATSPDQAVELLMEGHRRFVSGNTLHCDAPKLIKGTEAKQTPFACVIGCIDSRVPPEIVLDQQIGDIFDARVAGNYPNSDIIGSMEYATKVAGAKAILVLGHTACGAIKGAVDNVTLGNLTGLLAEIMPAVDQTPLKGERASTNHEFVNAVAETNVKLSVARLTEKSDILKGLVDEGKLKIIGGIHDISTGQIRFMV